MGAICGEVVGIITVELDSDTNERSEQDPETGPQGSEIYWRVGRVREV
jgi:hypothetical protein